MKMKPTRSRPFEITHRRSTLVLGSLLAAATAVTGCATEEIESNQVLLTAQPTATNPAVFMIEMDADVDTAEALPAAWAMSPSYFLRVDGLWAVGSDGGVTTPIKVGPGLSGGTWSIAVGTHVFELVDGSAHVVATTEPCQVEAEKTNRLMFFGHRSALQHRFFSIGHDVPPGMQRFAVTNLLRDGSAIEAVTCADVSVEPPQGCTVTSTALGYGEVFTGEAPLRAGSITFDGPHDGPAGSTAIFYNPGAIGVYYRISPPPGASTTPDPLGLYALQQLALDPQQPQGVVQNPIYTAAPVFMATIGASGWTLY
jgi:hypothetical protein